MGTAVNIDLFAWPEIRDRVKHYQFDIQTDPEEIEKFCETNIIDRYYFDHNKGHYNGFAPTPEAYWDGWLWFENPKDQFVFKLCYGSFTPSSR